ncbi:hypothetical protein HY630_02155 [Candidatus Uhrbacteria bacterium]|nr:hypothetical protein [Candidatus Uhrbacteria bacterium]
MTTKSQTIALPARHVNLRPVRKPYSAPRVTKEELSLAIQMIAGMYEPLAPHAETLEDWASKSRQTAYAALQFAWTLAKVEAEIGDRDWFRSSWMPAIKDAQTNGEAMAEDLPEGSPVKMTRGERDLLISAVGPMFCAKDEATDALSKLIPVAIVGKRGTHLRAALKLVELVLGDEGYATFQEQLKAARAEDASSPAPDAIDESDEDSDVAEEPDADAATGTEG